MTLFISLFGLMLMPIIQPGAVASDSPLVDRFLHIYEPSGVLYLSNGDVLIIEDDGRNPLHLISLADHSSVDFSRPHVTMKLSTSVDDLEGIALGKDETVFLITSFSPDRKKKRKKKRQRLIQFQIKDGRIVHELHFDNLLPYLIQQLKKEKHIDGGGADTLNIEGITFDAEKKRLFIGLRSPLVKGRAIIAVLENPYEIFSGTTPPIFTGRNIMMDLGGEGIRGITYNYTLGLYLITNEVKNKKGKLRPGLWGWDGKPADKPTRISLPKMKGIKNIEGITQLTVGTRHFLLLVCDDGERKKQKGAHYILMDAEFLSKISVSR